MICFLLPKIFCCAFIFTHKARESAGKGIVHWRGNEVDKTGSCCVLAQVDKSVSKLPWCFETQLVYYLTHTSLQLYWSRARSSCYNLEWCQSHAIAVSAHISLAQGH